ncbi:MAG TPA: SusC/RagA family TonB-linked outer membrane protein [Puia sp.]|nr:SusC/RagA family TonB-linked outer membrane protein [Puia sp.]
MRLTIVLLIIGCLHVNAKGFAQTVTLHRYNTPIESILTEIHRQTGYSFAYNMELLEKIPPVSLSVDHAPLQTTLDLLLNGQPLTYSFIDKTIVLREQTRPAPEKKDSITGTDPGQNLKGTVNNTHGQALAGASVMVKRTRKGTISGANGSFTIHDFKADDYLIVSYIGYKTKTLPLRDMIQSGGTIYLDEAEDKMDQAVIKAYGTTSQRLATGDIVRVSGEDIARQPVSNPLLALQGRVPGLVVSINTGYASSPVKLEIRGRNSLSSQFTSDPLYIIDGIPQTILEVGGFTTYQSGSTGILQNGMISPAGGQSPYFGMNPNDIESIEVLKDADATAIYGSRGANGVILITTKKGHAVGTRLEASLQEGVNFVTRHWPLLNREQYLQMRREAFQNAGIAPTISNAPDLVLWDTTRYTDWQKELLGHTGQVLTANVGLSGGDEKNQFRINGAYNRSTEILTHSGSNQLISVQSNFSHHSADNKLTTNLDAGYNYTNINLTSTPLAISSPPNAPPVYNNKGGLNYAPWDSAGLGYLFPFAPMLMPYDSKTGTWKTSFVVSYVLMHGLVFTMTSGYNTTHNEVTSLTPIAAQDPALQPLGSGQFGTNDSHTWQLEPRLGYDGYISHGKLSALIGASKSSSVTNGISQYAVGFSNDQLLNSVTNAASVFNFQNYGQYKYAAIFASINYNWLNKYILNLNARRDGSSRFGPGRQYGSFGSVAAAWILTEEKWIKKALPSAISFVKLRSSYGTTGADDIGDYQYLSQWSNLGQSGLPMYSYGGINSLVSQHAVDQDYHWPTTRKLSTALELGFLKDRITLISDYYRNSSNDQLASLPTPVFSGFPTVVANWPANVVNDGWEFTLKAGIINGPKFNWSSSFNISFNRNRLVGYPNLDQSPYISIYKIGRSINTIYLYHYKGVDPATGTYQYEDANHDGQIGRSYSTSPGTGTDDRVTSVDLSPRYTGGWSHNLSYKGWGLNLLFYFKKQKAQNGLVNGIPGNMVNQSLAVFRDHWQKPGDHAAYARFTPSGDQSDGNFMQSDGAYTDASFLRLSEIAVSYTLPATLAKKAGMQSCSIFVHTRNLFVITGYKGIDPEVTNFGLPPSRNISGGLSLTF